MLRAPRTPRGTLRTFALLAVTAVVTMAGECRESRSLGGPFQGLVASLVFSGSNPHTATFPATIVFTVTARDADGRPVRDSQGGITINFCSECFTIQIVDVPDPDNAVIEVRASPGLDIRSSTLSAEYTNDGGARVQAFTDVFWNVDIAQLVSNPASPITIQLAQILPVAVRAVNGQGATVARADEYIVGGSPRGASPPAEWLRNDETSHGDGIEEGSVAGVRLGSGIIDFCFEHAGTDTCPRGAPTLDLALAVNVVKLDVARLVTVPSTLTPLGMAPGERITVVVTAEAADGRRVLAADGGDLISPTLATFPQQITATSSSPTVVRVAETTNATPLDGSIAFVLEALGPGDGEVLVRHPDLAAPVRILVHVAGAVPAGHVVSTTSSDAIHVGLTTDLEAVVLDDFGATVPGDAHVTATTSNAAVAVVEARLDTVANDGRVVFRVRGTGVGVATITYRYPGGPGGAVTTATTVVTVNP